MNTESWGLVLVAYIALFAPWSMWRFYKAGNEGDPLLEVGVWTAGLVLLLGMARVNLPAALGAVVVALLLLAWIAHALLRRRG